MWQMLIVVLYISRVSSQPCNEPTSVDISSGQVLPGGFVLHEGLKYNPEQYYYEINNTTMRGCVCQVTKCVRKCCPLGQHWNVTKKGCIGGEVSFDLKILEDGKIVNRRDFRFVYGRQTCKDKIRTRATLGNYIIEYWSMDVRYFFTKNGMLYLRAPHSLFPWTRLSVEDYCVDSFVKTMSDNTSVTELDAIICVKEDVATETYFLPMIGMYVSTVFLTLTLAVYVFVPELRNMHGRVLMAYLSSMLVAFLFLATTQLLTLLNKHNTEICLSFTFIVYFSLLAAFFWLNVMCFDIWWAFRGMTRVNRFDKRRYAAYCAYAFGIPTVLTIVLISLEFAGSNLPDHIVIPQLQQDGACFLNGDARLVYLYCPMLILTIANTGFFIATIVRITQVQKQAAAVLKNGESSTHDQYRKEKQRLALYVKLFIVMGLNWALEVVSALKPDVPIFWNIVDLYNVLMGLTIFIIFICKKKIFRLIKKRYDVLRGVPPSRSQTCSTRNTSSISRDE